MNDLIPLKAEEQAIVVALLDPMASIEILVPDNWSDAQLWKSLTACCKAIGHVQKLSDRLRPIIGRMLTIVQNNPAMCKQWGYSNFQDFIKRGVAKELGIGRSTAYEIMHHAKLHPSLSPERYAAIGPQRLSIVSKFTREGDSKYQEHMRAAEVLSTTKLREYAEERKLISVNETVPAAIVIQTTLDVKKQWEEFVEDGRVQSVCGSSSAGIVLQHMIEECSSWLSEG